MIYYDLVRHLITLCWNRVKIEQIANAGELADWLSREQRKWLYTEQEDLSGLTPFLVIEYERARLPVNISRQMLEADSDSPNADVIDEFGGPCFWHHDGSHCDEEFTFSFHRTLEAWEQEQREWEEMSRKYRQDNL